MGVTGGATRLQPPLLRLNSDDPSEDRFGSSLELAAAANKGGDGTRKTPLKGLPGAPSPPYPGNADEAAARKKFLDQQVENIMAKKEARMSSEPVKKSRR